MKLTLNLHGNDGTDGSNHVLGRALKVSRVVSLNVVDFEEFLADGDSGVLGVVLGQVLSLKNSFFFVVMVIWKSN